MPDISALCVYCGSSGDRHPRFHDAARDLGRMLGENRIRLVYGGGGIGLMGVLARAAQKAGGRVTGVIPDFLIGAEIGDAPGTDLEIVSTMHDRKRRMAEIADAFAVLPGSVGTLDETIEMVTWRQLGLHDKPIVLVNLDGYWDRLIALIDQFVAAGFARAWTRDLFLVVDRVEDVLPAIRAMPAPVAPAPGGRALGRS